MPFLHLVGKSSYFSLQDLFALDKFSVLRHGYFAVIMLQVSVEGSQHNPSSVRIVVGAIPLANFGKEARETFVQFFLASYLTKLPSRPLLSAHDYQTFIHVLVVLLYFSLLLFGKLLYFFIGNFRESCRHLLENKSKNVIVFSVVMVTLLYHPFVLLYHYGPLALRGHVTNASL